jgi:hypothetical protein
VDTCVDQAGEANNSGCPAGVTKMLAGGLNPQQHNHIT